MSASGRSQPLFLSQSDLLLPLPDSLPLARQYPRQLLLIGACVVMAQNYRRQARAVVSCRNISPWQT